MTFDTTIISNIQQEFQAFKQLFLDETSVINQRLLNIEQQIDSQTTSGMHTLSRQCTHIISKLLNVPSFLSMSPF